MSIIINGRRTATSQGQWIARDVGLRVELHGFVPLIARAAQTAGTIVSSSQVIYASEVRVMLDALTWTDDPTHTITLTIEESLDGGSQWRHVASATFQQGARGKDGDLPSVGVSRYSPLTMIRASLTLGQALEVGVLWAR